MTAPLPLGALSIAALPTPTPTPLPFNPDDVTPGVIGFSFTFLIFILVGLVAWDMLRRVRRAGYRMEVRERIAAEVAARDAAAASGEAGGGEAGGGEAAPSSVDDAIEGDDPDAPGHDSRRAR